MKFAPIKFVPACIPCKTPFCRHPLQNLVLQTSFILSATAHCLLPTASFAQTPAEPTVEGRPAMVAPSGGGASPFSPAVGAGELLFEPMRLKRTAPLDATNGPDGLWDRLYSVPGSDGARTAYLDWDADYLYLGVEIPAAAAVRFDIDGADDGWLRGADNLTVQIGPSAAGLSPVVTAYRFDTVQNRDHPVWAASPIPTAEIKALAGKTTRGTYTALIAIPKTETMGLQRSNGAKFGVRVDAGDLPDPASETNFLSLRPMLRLTLADMLSARTSNNVTVKVNRDGPEVVLTESFKATLEVKNNGSSPVRVARMFLQGSKGSAPLLDSSTFTAVDIPPGKTIKRELRTTPAPNAPLGTLTVEGKIELESGDAATALTSVDRVEPYEISFVVDKNPVSVSQIPAKGGVREVKVVLRSRIRARNTAKFTLTLPSSLALESGTLTRERTLGYRDDVQGTLYKIRIPTDIPFGVYPIEATAEIAGRLYKGSGEIVVVK